MINVVENYRYVAQEKKIIHGIFAIWGHKSNKLCILCLGTLQQGKKEAQVNIPGGAKVGLQLWVPEIEFIVVLLFISYCAVFHLGDISLLLPLPVSYLHNVKVLWELETRRVLWEGTGGTKYEVRRQERRGWCVMLVFKYKAKSLERRGGQAFPTDRSMGESLDAWGLTTPLGVQGDWLPETEEGLRENEAGYTSKCQS